MPGISAIFKKSGSKPISAGFCSKIRKEMLHFPFYASRQIIAGKSANIGFTGYEDYPVKIIDHKNFNLVLEGRIYNLEKNSLENKLIHIAEAQIEAGNEFNDELKRFLLTAEGEFIIIIYDKLKKRVILANDVMGRLPLYYFQDTESLLFSRELKFILPFLSQIEFNRDGILEYLLYGFPFEENTLIEKIGFFPSATYMCFDMVSGKTVKDFYHVLNIDTCTNFGDRKKMAADMCQIFQDALSNRVNWVNKNKTIVSLSGGFDSRATLAGIKKLGLNPTAVTAQSKEECSAREVAGYIGAEVYVIPQGHDEKERSFADIVFLKDGLDCHPNLGQLYQNLQNLRDCFGGDVVYFTGISGGEITRQSHPTAGLSSLNSLVRYLLKANDSYLYSTKKVAAIVRKPENQIRKHLQRHLETFPEKNIYRKYIRFRHEFDVRFAGEAEDRNRFYFWTISPFFAFPFFNYVMSIDENRKTSWLFRDFLFSIDPNTCRAKYFNYHLPLNSSFVLWVFAFVERIIRHAFVKNRIRQCGRLIKTYRRLIHGSNVEEKRCIQKIREELLDLLKNSKPIKSFFNHPDLPNLIKREDDIQGLERLRIVFIYIDRATRWHATLGEQSTATIS